MKFFSILIICVILKFTYNIYKPRPIQFERISNMEELRELLNEKYLNKDINIMLSDMMKSDVNIIGVYKVRNKEDMIGHLKDHEIEKYKDIYKYSLSIKYHTYLLSYDSIKVIKIYPMLDREGRIFKISAYKFPAF